jgi:hypothetical protein
MLINLLERLRLVTYLYFVLRLSRTQYACMNAPFEN